MTKVKTKRKKRQNLCTLNWAGKDTCLDCLDEPLQYDFIPCPEESVNFDTTENLFFECDNLDALKYLQTTHLNKVKCIYIDPPYNTGKTRQYKDDFGDITGCKHSDWLNMMKPRLVLGRELLSDDGVIFISIDDNEQAQLKMLCDEVFGKENFIADLVWTNKEGGGGSDSKLFKIKHEHILCFSNNISRCVINGIKQYEDNSYQFEDSLVTYRGRYKLIKLNSFSINYSKSLDYPIEFQGKNIHPSENGKRGCWRWSKEKFDWGLKNNFIVFKLDNGGSTRVYTKQYFKVDNEDKQIERTLPPSALIDNFSSTQASKFLKNINAELFNYSKPKELIEYLINRVVIYSSLMVLDYFAGSGTTAHATMQLNGEDGGKRKFILCQTPDPLDGEYSTIADFCKERMRRAGKKVLEEAKHKDIDIGFQVWKVRKKGDTNE
jgi:adenine-specific DNA-methyltransferase